MFIRQNGQLKQAKPRAATTNAVALTIIEVAVPTARFGDAAQLGELHRYVGHDVEITIRARPLPADPDEPRPMETLWSADGQDERMRPGPTETCSACGTVIGDDPEAAFYTPIAGPPRPVCGECAAEPENVAELLDARAEGGDDAGGETDAQLGDGPMPERPTDEEPVTTPIRRGRARAESAP